MSDDLPICPVLDPDIHAPGLNGYVLVFRTSFKNGIVGYDSRSTINLYIVVTPSFRFTHRRLRGFLKILEIFFFLTHLPIDISEFVAIREDTIQSSFVPVPLGLSPLARQI